MASLYPALLLLALWGNSLVLCGSHPGKRRQSTSREDSASSIPQTNSRAEREREKETGLAPELDFMAEFVGKHRLLVLTAPSHTDNYLLMMEKQIKDMESEGLNCRLAERDTLIITIIQNAMMEGRITRPSFKGEAVAENLDSDMVTKLLHYLDMEDQTFSMLLLKKNLMVRERFPYPVRLEAIIEIIDQLPARKLEKITRKKSAEKCKITKKILVAKKPGAVRKKTFSSQRQGNVTSLAANLQKPLDKRATLRKRVQDILSGRFRFVIHKPPPGAEEPGPPQGGKPTEDPNNQGNPLTANGQSSSITSKNDGVKEAEEGKQTDQETRGEKSSNDSKSQRKGKGKKGGKKKKGKRGGKKSEREAQEKEKVVLKEFLEKFQGKRRLVVMSSPSNTDSQYVKQREQNEKTHCGLALRKVSVLSILGSEHSSTITLQHYQLDTESPFDPLTDTLTNPQLGGQMRKEYGLSSDTFSMMITDYGLTPYKVFYTAAEAPITVDFIDTFPSRKTEWDQEKTTRGVCTEPEGPQNSLMRFMSKRRLLIISAPYEDDYSLQQQLQALKGQECPMGQDSLLRSASDSFFLHGTVINLR
uniref:DUF4174 domain-containing protein n=1 Tax=Denticeps clupeoides TaxID=299321 RepID=A0AAY4BZP1_9TELE